MLVSHSAVLPLRSPAPGEGQTASAALSQRDLPSSPAGLHCPFPDQTVDAQESAPREARLPAPHPLPLPASLAGCLPSTPSQPEPHEQTLSVVILSDELTCYLNPIYSQELLLRVLASCSTIYLIPLWDIQQAPHFICPQQKSQVSKLAFLMNKQTQKEKQRKPSFPQSFLSSEAARIWESCFLPS